ncbi:Protein kinase domain-containing protein [Prosthecobacter debontii]|uniref:Protein kinase domain-containing protein n=1 Tax=Prosthecobacter debontii TaxID=48467 RepID=A0A1T4Y448_9BACT|nr:serine/threonine-protein kinase [Prosthecobacter debontii]SKA96587.1 Protein kinase domain-containing protein [Prosthecobacter debontii]
MTEEEIFHAVLEQDDPQERRRILEEHASQDPVLHRRVEALLASLEADFMHVHLQPPTEVLANPPAEPENREIGPYKLLQQIGEGGFGIVWMAEQTQPVQRKVALKIIKAGMDSKEVIARFEQERQALALMDHPNIARVLDAGTTTAGKPFFVMELVRGVPITRFADEHLLTPQDRLSLFIKVCRAVQHAHMKGVIHRDLKPSNILVTLHDGVPVPKVIDFGVAKAMQRRLTDKTLFTHFEQMVGTPLYMAPEQAELSGLDIDTRCDIYALGVLLYELLTGHTPFSQEELMRAGFDEMRRLIREREPKKPSTLLKTLAAATVSTVAGHRQSEPPKLIGLLRGDLDWIVMKAMEKDRRRRYETASALADDLQRHLDHEPVLARPPSTAYRLQKLLQKNRAAFITITLVALSLLAGLAVSTTLYVRLRVEKAQRTVEAAQFAIMSGEDEWITAAIRECGSAGVPQTFIGLLLAEQHLIQGRVEEAISTLEDLVHEAPKSIPARALLATAHDLVDDKRGYTRVMASLAEAQPKEREDYLILGHALSHSEDARERQRGVDYMVHAIQKMRDSPMARVLLAEARTRQAVHAHSLEEIQEAIADINAARGWQRHGIAVLAISAWAHAVGAQIAQEKSQPALSQQYLAISQTDGEQLATFTSYYAEKYLKLQKAIFSEMGKP